MGKYLLDEHLSKKMIGNLLPLFFSVLHVKDTPLVHFFDNEIWDFARMNSYTIITKDNDFLHLSNLHGCPPKVIRLRCGNQTTSYICNLLIKNHNNITTFAESDDCYMDII